MRSPSPLSRPVRQGCRAALAAGILILPLACSSVEEDGDDDERESRPTAAAGAAVAHDASWRQEFDLSGRTLQATGRNRFFVLEPGFQLVLEGKDERLTITVLDQTRRIDGVETRVVEEREEEDGELVEVSRNYFAICRDSGDVFYFGEDVDVYEDGVVKGHPGAWHAGESGARAGLIMPGEPRIGDRYYQELSPSKAMDRAEVVSLTHRLKTPAGEFSDCLRTQESNALEEDEREFKTYAPGIGLIQDEDLLLVRYGPVESR